MFILTKIADLVQIAPDKFGKPSRISIEDAINAKYANRVIQKIGLCICMYDLLWASDGLIGHGNGGVHVNVEFRMIVFRPFKGETIFGRITRASQDGIDSSDHNENAWIWIFDGQPMWYDKNEMVRLQVLDELWQDQTPESTEQEAIDKAKKLSPYSIQGTMMKEGLGVCLWWDDAEEGDGDEEG
ncbi:DNA-directed RNA polymerase III complex subunit Rpc25 [Parahypoxylon ruwenzoriense]